MKTSTEVLKNLGVRTSNDFEKVMDDFPIGHAVTFNGVKVYVVGHQPQDIYGAQCLFIIVKAANGDGMVIDPYFWGLCDSNPK